MVATRSAGWCLLGLLATGCSSGDPAPAPVLDGPPSRSAVRHVVVILQENHTFDSYFGRYCTAAAGSNPTCTDGPACCEAAPATEPSGASPVPLDDAANAGFDPNHTRACETAKLNNGRMDQFVHGVATVAGQGCADPRNFAVAPTASVATYTGYAQRYALADRYFQPIVGQSSSNDIYFAVAREVFHDNDVYPFALGSTCGPVLSQHTYTDPTIADLLLDHGYRFATYDEGIAAQQAAPDGGCADPPRDCPAMAALYPCIFDPSDQPFEYYQRFHDSSQYIKDYALFAADIDHRALPHFAMVRGLGYHSEHPGVGTTVSAGETFVDQVVQRILASPYAQDTLILVTWDEGGGFYDHVPPPAVSTADNEGPGTRVPLLALGRFARRNHVSHVPMEHASILKFLEWNFLGATGQLHARDATVNNLGSLLDPATTGTAVPEN